MLLILINPQIGPLSGATTPGQSGPGSNGNEGVLCIPQSSSIAGTSPSDLFSVISETLVRWGLTPLQRCSQCILQPQLTGQAFREGQKWCNHTLVLTKLYFLKNSWFYFIRVIWFPCRRWPTISSLCFTYACIYMIFCRWDIAPKWCQVLH